MKLSVHEYAGLVGGIDVNLTKDPHISNEGPTKPLRGQISYERMKKPRRDERERGFGKCGIGRE
jgi:hypothetical protein